MYRVNAIYPTYQGEQNKYGIGRPVIFVRLQGCHLRCYVKTLGILCDTPEALKVNGEAGEIHSLSELIGRIAVVSKETGIKYLCLTGGDPLVHSLTHLLVALTERGYEISVETSGTISMAQYRLIKKVYWVLDYKLKSAGIKHPFIWSDLSILNQDDWVKFVVYDDEDYTQFVEVVKTIPKHVNVCVGLYWNPLISSTILMKRLAEDFLLERVHINMQAHKLLTLADNTDVSKVTIPTHL